VFVTVTDERLDIQLGDVVALQAPVRAVVESLDPDAVYVFDAPAMLEAFDVLVRLGQAGKTLMARRAEAACMWQRAGYRSAAEQIAAVSGSSVSAARAMLETSKQLETLPATADALRAGKLSAAKAEVIAAAATVAPGSEAGLLDDTDAPLAVVRDQCLRARAVDRDAAYERIRRERYAREFTDKEGAWNFIARGTPDDGALFRSAHGPIVDEQFHQARSQDRRESRDAYAFDAFIELAERARGTDNAPAANTKTKQPAPRFMGLIRADLETLQRGAVEGDEICEIAGLGPIPATVARDLLGDAVLKLVLTDGVDVANVTHLGRSPTMAQQVALWWRSPMCTRDDCTRTWRLENDHRIGWKQTHRTRLDELDPLCEHEHDLKTYFGWSLVPGQGRRAFVPPDDPRHPNYRAPPDP